MKGKMHGKAAWISGATSGIGAAAARLFAREGASVALVGRRIDRAEALAREITDAGGRARAFRCDVASEAEIARSIEQAADAFGRLDCIVNNAGMVDVRDLHEYTVEQWDRVMNINVRSVFLAFRAAHRYLRNHSGSTVVNVGSISSFVGQARTPVYTTSKHAMLGLSRSIALDYAADGIRCNCVCPGITDTPMLWEHLNTLPDPDAALAKRLERVPMNVALTPEDVARSILFLACDDSAGITGTSLTIDCGYLTAAEWTAGETAFQENATPPKKEDRS